MAQFVEPWPLMDYHFTHLKMLIDGNIKQVQDYDSVGGYDALLDLGLVRRRWWSGEIKITPAGIILFQLWDRALRA